MYCTIVQALAPKRQHPGNRVDVLVIGGGVVGAAAALAAARAGQRVALVEAGSPATARGSSKGPARIYAPAAYPDESYLELGLRALERWRELEAEAGETLLQRTGALSRGDFAEREMPALREAGVAADFLSPAAALDRFGVALGDDAPLLHQPDAGVIHADRARRALLQTAEAAGAELHWGERVRTMEEHGDQLAVETTRRDWACSAAIVAAGPWSGDLLAAAGIDAGLNASVQSVAHFDLADPAARPVALIEFDGEEPFACWDPGRGMKAAFHARGPAAGSEPDRAEVEPAAIGHVVEWVDGRFPGLGAVLAEVEPCIYTNTADERFVLERNGRVVIASACSGQGFQFAPETGARAADLALEVTEASSPSGGGSRR
jgi:sarcosine oxidase